MEEMLKLMGRDDWKEFSTKDGVTVFTRMMEKNIKAVLSKGEIPYPPRVVGLF